MSYSNNGSSEEGAIHFTYSGRGGWGTRGIVTNDNSGNKNFASNPPPMVQYYVDYPPGSPNVTDDQGSANVVVSMRVQSTR